MVVVGVLLAGGAGRRLGSVRKADLRLDNVPLGTWLEKALRVQCDEFIVSVRSSLSSLESSAIVVEDDPFRVKGPAAGLLAGALWCEQNRPRGLMLSVSVDTPFFPTDFVGRAKPLMTQECGCVAAAFGERDYPTIALWRPDRLVELLSVAPSGSKGPSLRDIGAQLGAVHLDYRGFMPDDPFIGINSLPDLLSLSGRQKSSGKFI